MKSLNAPEAWFITGSQDLYGPETLKQVALNSQEIVKGLNGSGSIPVKIVYKPVVTIPDEIMSLNGVFNSEKTFRLCFLAVASVNAFLISSLRFQLNNYLF